MTKKIGIATLLIILVCFNFSIWQKEKVKKSNDDVLLELAPVDPRSLMQGDYMTLNYKVAEDAYSSNQKMDRSGHLIIEKGENNVAKFIAVYSDQNLTENQRLIKYKRKWRPTINPNSFMFQEGKAEDFEEAKYALFKYKGVDNYVLDSLLKEDFSKIK